MRLKVSEDSVVIGANLKALRRRHKMTQKDVAALLGVCFQQVQKYENGKNRIPLEHIIALKQYWGVSYDDFFEGCADLSARGEDAVL
ncbi:MAG: helix-turn-helix domain-containing protein [Alphaproteobacteria bacterium]|jgi:transcriptional regulator with XRE-family HTH domain